MNQNNFMLIYLIEQKSSSLQDPSALAKQRFLKQKKDFFEFEVIF